MKYRVGIVGSGFGGNVHAPAYTLHPKFDVVAIASPNRAEAVAAERKIPHAFPSVEAMLAQMGDAIDLVSVATPPADHHRSVMAAIAAGKNVLCEKPFGLRLSEAEEMAAAAERAGIVGALGFEFRYGSAQQALKELVVNGHMGALREIEVTRFGGDLRADVKRPPSSWWYDKAQGGGLANSFMPHLVDLGLWTVGKHPRSSHGFLRTANAQRTDTTGTTFTSTVADGCFALCDLGDGVAARLAVDATVAIDQMTIAIHSETRTAVASGVNPAELSLYVVDSDESNEYDLTPSPYAKYAPIGQTFPMYLGLLDDFAARLAGERDTCPSFADGLAVQRVLATIGYDV